MSFSWGSPIATDQPYFTSVTNSARSVPTIISELNFPYPTNIWWKNLLVSGTTLDTKPYILKMYWPGIGICFPGRTASDSAVYESFVKNLTIECSEEPTSNKVQSYDDITMTYRWQVDSTHKMIAPITRGQLFFTMIYTALTPKFLTDHAITSVNGESIPGTHTGTKFKVVMNNGQTWIIYASSSISLVSTTTSLTSTGIFTGTIQAVLLKQAGYETILDSHALSYPTACSIGHSVTGETDTETWTFTKVGSGNFLWHPLTIHMGLAISPTLTGLKYKRLWMDDTCEAFSVGTTLTFEQTLPEVPESYPLFDTGKVSAIQTAFSTDKTFNPGISNDPYFGGKALNKLAELGFISAHSQIADASARASIINTLKTSVVAWLDATNTNKIKYDSTWGGLCTTNGLADQNADFGNGIYNDHHFHWGYHIRAAAFLAKYDATFFDSYGSKVNELIRDIMNPSSDDTYFPRFRNHDFYHMHCWADGLTNFGDVHNQESISESVFAWYATALWGKVTGNENIETHARIILGKEITAGNIYWHHKSTDTELETTYEDNKITGIPWETKRDFATWFGANPEYIYGIQMIPSSPIAVRITPPNWMTEAWPVINTKVFTRTYPVSISINNGGTGYSGSSGSYSGYTIANGVSTSGGTGSGLTLNMNIRNSDGKVTEVFIVNKGSGYVDGDIVSLVNGTGGLSAGGSGVQLRLNVKPSDSWAGLLHAGHAVIDKEQAWTDTNTLSSWDDGTTKTNQLAYIASIGNASTTEEYIPSSQRWVNRTRITTTVWQ